MDVAKILADLRHEREQLEEAIISLERLAMGRGKRRGRPPAWMSEARKTVEAQKSAGTLTETKRRGRPPGSKNKTSTRTQPTENAAAPMSAMSAASVPEMTMSAAAA